MLGEAVNGSGELMRWVAKKVPFFKEFANIKMKLEDNDHDDDDDDSSGGNEDVDDNYDDDDDDWMIAYYINNSYR